MPGNQPAKRKVGRPSSFDPDELPRVTKLCMVGLTNAQLSVMFGVDERTVLRWYADNPEFRQAVKAGREDADGEVVQSLYGLATGTSTRLTEQIIKLKDANGNERAEVIEVQVTDPISATAQIFWLKNRQRERWRDVNRTELTGPGGGPIRTEAVEARQLEVGERRTLRAFLEARADAEDVIDEAEQNEENEDGDDTR